MTRTRKVFKEDLPKINWEELYIKLYKHSLQTFIPIFIPFINRFIKIYSNIYDKNFPLLETEVKLKTL